MEIIINQNKIKLFSELNNIKTCPICIEDKLNICYNVDILYVLIVIKMLKNVINYYILFIIYKINKYLLSLMFFICKLFQMCKNCI